MDRTLEEKIAVHDVAATLMRNGILVANPEFDQLGGDLLGFTVAGEKAALCRIQVKYRNCVKKNVVIIPVEYVAGAFALFLNLKTKAGESTRCLLPDEIKQYAKAGKNAGKDVFRFTLTEEFVATMNADQALEFNDEKAKKLLRLTQESSAASAIYREFLLLAKSSSVLIETQASVIRLQKALEKIAVAQRGVELTEKMSADLGGLLAILKEKMGDDSEEQDE